MSVPCDDIASNEDFVARCNRVNDAEADKAQRALDAANFLGWTLSGRRYGVCAIEGERPGRVGDRRSGCVQQVASPGGSRCLCACCGAGACGCPGVSQVIVGRVGPIVAVDEVRIAGEVLDPSAYALLDGRRLVRRDGGTWPACQLLGRDDDDEDVLVVDYRWGIEPDPHARRAVATLACEFLKADVGDPDCTLPANVQSVSRQGISFEIVDPLDFLNNGRTGIYEFDLWIAAVNPSGLARPSRVRTPDIDEPVGGAAPPES